MVGPSSELSDQTVSVVDQLGDAVIEQVTALVKHGSGSRQAIEQMVLRGLSLSSEAIDRLSRMLDAPRGGRMENIGAALERLERKHAFFQACTMRRSAARRETEAEAEALAGRAEQIALQAGQMAAIDRLVEAYKATEAIEGRIAALRAAGPTATTPEPRVLDLARARVLVARRVIGGTLAALDEDG